MPASALQVVSSIEPRSVATMNKTSVLKEMKREREKKASKGEEEDDSRHKASNLNAFHFETNGAINFAQSLTQSARDKDETRFSALTCIPGMA